MPPNSSDLLAEVAGVWRGFVSATAPSVRERVAATAVACAPRLAARFYAELMAVPGARHFLSHERVQQRLLREMQRWIVGLFDVAPTEKFDGPVAHQVAVGAVHARIRLPVELLAIAFHVLGRELREELEMQVSEAGERTLTVHYAMAVMSIANGLILAAFVHEIERGVRNDEAYRHISFQHDAKFERERQRAALSEWAQRVLMSIPLPQQRHGLTPLCRSEFAQWLEHKGRVMFEGIEELDTVRAAMRQIDDAVLPLLAGGTLDQEDFPRLVQELDSSLELIRYVMNDLFDRVTSLDAGRDSVTRLLNRRYLHSILAREVATHTAAAAPFSVLLVRVHDAPGVGHDREPGEHRAHQLQRIAASLGEHVKAGDHLFRYSDQDFLIVEVETAPDLVWTRAQKLLQRLIAVAGGAALRRPVDIAVVAFDGHPDFQQLLRRAEFSIASAAGRADGIARA